MSLLLDALKSTEPDADADIGVEPEALESQEEPLDGAATLALLAAKPTAQAPLALAPTFNGVSAPPAVSAHEFVAPEPVASEAGPELVADDAAPIPARTPLATAARTAQIAAAPGPTVAAPPNARTAVTAPSSAPRTKKYALVLGALAALACIGLLGKALWWPSTNPISYPEVSEPQATPASIARAPTPTIDSVQVSSARPADQFAYAGNAPEIDLRDADAHRAATPLSAMAPGSTMAPERAMAPESTPRARAAATRASAATLSVTRSEGPSSIDRHVQAGYQALASGNIASAQNEYFAALELDPNNVDALMGAATVAARDGRAQAAAAAYAKVLKLEPGNPDATAAMATLGANGLTSETNESRLKILIASDDGGRPALHAALAGVYAADARWTEAAQEYFTALAKDPGNPDLAFNVAASLDQNRNLGMALNYYGQALAFARQRPTQIDLHALEQRISQLQARAAHAAGAPETP
jgi:Flp pilus assembly protein TadD